MLVQQGSHRRNSFNHKVIITTPPFCSIGNSTELLPKHYEVNCQFPYYGISEYFTAYLALYSSSLLAKHNSSTIFVERSHWLATILPGLAVAILIKLKIFSEAGLQNDGGVIFVQNTPENSQRLYKNGLPIGLSAGSHRINRYNYITPRANSSKHSGSVHHIAL